MGDLNHIRGLYSQVVDFKRTEMCTTPEALHVVNETRGLLNMQREAQSREASLPSFDITHLRSFATSIELVASTLLELEVLSKVVEGRCGIGVGDLQIWTSVQPLVPFPIKNDYRSGAPVRLDYAQLFSVYAACPASQDLVSAKFAFREAVEQLMSKRCFFIGDGSAAVSINEVAASIFERVMLPTRLDTHALRVVTGSVQIAMADLATELDDYHPNIAGPPTCQIETNAYDLYARAQAAHTLGTFEVDRKIARSLVRSALQALKSNSGTESSAEEAFEAALIGRRSLMERQVKALKDLVSKAAPSFLISRCKAAIDEARYGIRVLIGNRDWLIEELNK